MLPAFPIWMILSITTIVCGLWSLSYVFSVIHAGGVGKNGSTVAVSEYIYIYVYMN